MEIHHDYKPKTAFATGKGRWQFNIIPFGLCNAASTFERLLEAVLQGMNGESCLLYLDDVIILERSFDEHLKDL